LAGWNWDLHRPYIALALRHNVPLVAANLSSSDAQKVLKAGYAAVFDPAQLSALGLDLSTAPPWLAAQEKEIDTGHCHALPASLLPGMARAQLARDAVMASVLTEHAAGGVVLLAGNGYVRRDIGVPRWLSDSLRRRLFSVGYLEKGDAFTPESFDAVVYTAQQSRAPPCEALRHPPR
jgi:uncharacterized iron-regulated protein